MEGLLELVVEIFCELYFGLISAIMPNKKLGKRTEIVLNLICIVITVAVFLTTVCGIAILVNAETSRHKLLGTILLSVGCGVTAVHLIIFIVQRLLKRKRVKDLERRGVAASRAIGTRVHVTVDRKMGSVHPEHADMYYELNYGYVDGVIGGDGEPQDAYIVGVDAPLDALDGVVIAVIHRLNDVEDKWVVAPEGVKLKKEEIKALTDFGEKYFKTVIFMRPRQTHTGRGA